MCRYDDVDDDDDFDFFFFFKGFQICAGNLLFCPQPISTRFLAVVLLPWLFLTLLTSSVALLQLFLPFFALNTS
jgi:hypothetical protein